MSRKNTLIAFIILSIAGSIIVYNGTNLVIADVGNYTYGWNGLNLFASIPGFFFSIEFVTLAIFVIRLYLNTSTRKKTMMLYLKILIGHSIVGIAGVLLSSIYSYDSITSPYPFVFYSIGFLMIYVIQILLFTITLIRVKKKMPNDNPKRKITFGYVIYSICVAGFVYLAFNRFGAFLVSAKYIQLSTLHMTWVVYAWLLMPILLLYYMIFKDLNFYKDYNTQIIHLILLLCLNICFSISIYITGTHNTLFVSAISPAYGLDRLATFPYVGIVQFIVTAAFNIYLIGWRIVKKIQTKSK